MKHRLYPAILAAAALVLAGGCSKSPQQKAEEAQQKVEEARQKLEEKMPGGLNQMTEAMEKMGEAMKTGKAEPVDPKELEGLLPAEAGGLPRIEASGERTDQMGIKVSTAQAAYQRGEEPGRIHLKIMDLGSVQGFAAMGAVGWSMVELNNQTDDGYEKTFVYSGCKAYEKYDRTSRSGEMKVLAADRFLVEIEGADVSSEEIRAAMGAVDLGRLKGMKNAGMAE